ncbi:hypothetical protein PMI08_01557 [Brevibacillus sp. CF112]|uniref:hypothetical protein n=1 Tax=Brevibacillus TaxID=55080 RepID=UPI000271CC22|nr:hypothetical protein [Brevibacillus sp. CF112]EJL45672.1 hypothetical protein PMI08_01557 [Brevibacillus sp. CF112]
MARKTFTTTIDETIQKEFKAACAKNGDKMNDILETFMIGYANGDFVVEKELKLTLKNAKN